MRRNRAGRVGRPTRILGRVGRMCIIMTQFSREECQISLRFLVKKIARYHGNFTKGYLSFLNPQNHLLYDTIHGCKNVDGGRTICWLSFVLDSYSIYDLSSSDRMLNLKCF